MPKSRVSTFQRPQTKNTSGTNNEKSSNRSTVLERSAEKNKTKKKQQQQKNKNKKKKTKKKQKKTKGSWISGLGLGPLKLDYSLVNYRHRFGPHVCHFSHPRTITVEHQPSLSCSQEGWNQFFSPSDFQENISGIRRKWNGFEAKPPELPKKETYGF